MTNTPPATLRLTWSLTGAGWATCTITDQDAEAAAICSHLTDAPAELLTAVARLAAGATTVRADFEAEPAVFWWLFTREAEACLVRTRLLEVPERGASDTGGFELWSSYQEIDILARAVIRCFDDVAHAVGEQEYQRTWGRPFPRTELEALRRLWRERRAGAGRNRGRGL